MKAQCMTCRFFQAMPVPPAKASAPKAPPQGNCLRYPPQMISYIAPPPVVGGPAQLQVMSVLPTVPAVGSCGEHQSAGADND